MLQNAIPLRTSAPGPPNISDEHVSCTAPATENASLPILCKNVPRLPSFLEMLQNPHVLLTSDKVHNPLHLPRETTSECQKVIRCCALSIFDFEMCFAPQQRVLFHTFSTTQLPKVLRTWSVLHILTSKCASRHNCVNFLDISTSNSAPNDVFLAFSLANLLRATTACTFSSLIWPDGSAPAASASLLFDPWEPQIIGQTQCFATFLPFRALASSFF